MFWIASNLLAAIQQEDASPFDLFLQSFRQHFEDQRAMLPMLGLGLLIAAVIAVDIFVGLRIVRGCRHAPKKHDTH